MCGIAGILRVGPVIAPEVAIPERWLATLDAGIASRGPDGQGRWRSRIAGPEGSVAHVALVHRRLAILDPAHGAQPMVLPGDSQGRGEVAITFNGCIYNHASLRQALIEHGHAFTTDHSDTESLLHGHRHWGRAFHERIEGMYAAGIWDADAGELVLMRDLMGEKPLVYAEVRTDPETEARLVVFASSAAAVVRLLHQIRREIGSGEVSGIAVDGVEGALRLETRGVIDKWLAFGWSEFLPWAGVREVKPGQLVWFDGAGRSGRRRISVDVEASKSMGLDEQSLEDELRRAVMARLESDVPLGCFLSGGLDSGLVAAFAQEALRAEGKKLRTFTMRMPHGGYDESEAAGLTARMLGTDHTTLEAGAAEAADLVMLIESLGLPAGDSSLLPTYWLSRAAREHVTVALAGDGGDELFGGYQRHVAAPSLANWRMLLRVMGAVPWPERDPKRRTSKLARLCRAARGAGYDDLVAIFDQSEMHELTAGRAKPAGFRVPKNVMAHDRDGYLPSDLLRKADTASMAVALELRSPMLASSLVFRASATARSALMPRGERKGLLKRVARRHLPPEVVGLPKSGFAIPIGAWFREETGFRSLMQETLGQSEPFPGLASEIDLARINTMRREHDAVGNGRGRDHGQRLYALLALAIWCRWNRSLGEA